MGNSILIVDDSSVSRKLIIRLLSDLDMSAVSIYEAGNGKEGLAVLEEHTIDVILTDYNMPVMDGLEFVEHISDIYPKGTYGVIIITSRIERADMLKALKAGADEYVVKPIEKKKLKELLNKYLKSS